MFSYPHKHKLPNGEELTIDLLKSDQYKEYFDFLNRLTDDDKLYLKYDVTNIGFVEERVKAIEKGNRVSVVAWNQDGKIVGSSTLYWTNFGWKSHIGKLRIIVDPDYRKLGLSKYLAQLIFFKAQEMRNLDLVEAEVMEEQKAAIHILEDLGFKKAAVLPNYIVDTKGKKHNLIIMVADLESLIDKYENMVWDEEFKGG